MNKLIRNVVVVAAALAAGRAGAEPVEQQPLSFIDGGDYLEIGAAGVQIVEGEPVINGNRIEFTLDKGPEQTVRISVEAWEPYLEPV